MPVRKKPPISEVAEQLELNHRTSRVPSNAEWAWRLVLVLLAWSVLTAGAFVGCKYWADLLTAIIVTLVMVAGGASAIWIALRWIFSVSLLQRSMMAVGYTLAGTLFVKSFGVEFKWGENIPFEIHVRSDLVDLPLIIAATIIFVATQIGVVASQAVQGWFSKQN